MSRDRAPQGDLARLLETERRLQDRLLAARRTLDEREREERLRLQRLKSSRAL